MLKAAALTAMLLLATVSCSGKTPYYNTSDAFTRYPEAELSTFSIFGTAACNSCRGKDITALQVEVVPADDPTKSLTMDVFDGLGSFSFSDIRYGKGAKLTVYGKLIFGNGNTGIETDAGIEVPDSDGDTVSVVLNF